MEVLAPIMKDNQAEPEDPLHQEIEAGDKLQIDIIDCLQFVMIEDVPQQLMTEDVPQ